MGELFLEFDMTGGERARGRLVRFNKETVVVCIKTCKPRPIRRQEHVGTGPYGAVYRSRIVDWDKSEHERVIKRHIRKHNVVEVA